MRGPIDYIIVGFEGLKFDGSILKEVAAAIDSGVIALVALTVINKDKEGAVMTADVHELGDDYAVDFVKHRVIALRTKGILNPVEGSIGPLGVVLIIHPCAGNRVGLALRCLEERRAPFSAASSTWASTICNWREWIIGPISISGSSPLPTRSFCVRVVLP